MYILFSFLFLDSTNSVLLFAGMGQPSSRSDSEYSDVISDVDMEDVSMLRSATDVISPDEGSDDYSFMSIGSSDDNSGLPYVRRKHRPKSLNLSRSHSATSSEDETTDSAISTDVESKYNAVMPPDPHELRIALAASAFVEDMRVADMANDTDEEVAEISSAREESGENKIRFSPSAPISPSWREGFESPPFSPRRRDSYPGKRRGSSPVSPKDKRFNYTDISPPSRQLSLEDLYDKEAHACNHESTLVPYPQRPSPKSPDEMKDSFYSTSGEMFSFDKPASSLKKSKPFYSLDTAQNDLSDTTTVMDLATYAATIASNTANLTSMTVSPTNLEDLDEIDNHVYTAESRDSSSPSPVSPGIYDNAPYLDEKLDPLEEDEELELADPSQKAIDYQGSKRQKARPPTTDWSPVIDLSPILDVSPSLEEAEQAEMLAQQQEERQRQASREEEDEIPEENRFARSNQDVDYQYYGLKRYERVEDISELVKQNNGTFSPEKSSVGSADSEDNKSNDTINEVKDIFEVPDNVLACASIAPSSVTPSVVSAMTKTVNSIPTANNLQQVESKTTDDIATKRDTSDVDNISSPKKKQTESESPSNSSKGKVRRKLPQPTPEIVATQKQPVPKPRRKDKPPEPTPPKPTRVAKPESKEPSKPTRVPKGETKEPNRAAPKLVQAVPKQATPKSTVQKQESDERRRTAKDMKAKPDPLIINHIETEEASASPQYRVLESPPSPEQKSMIRREYSDSASSVSPSSSPDRDLYLYPSPVTPPDSDSSPPKPHSPSSGTDFDDEGTFVESPKIKHKEIRSHQSQMTVKEKESHDRFDKPVQEKVRIFEKVNPTTLHHVAFNSYELLSLFCYMSHVLRFFLLLLQKLQANYDWFIFGCYIQASKYTWILPRLGFPLVLMQKHWAYYEAFTSVNMLQNETKVQ